MLAGAADSPRPAVARRSRLSTSERSPPRAYRRPVFRVRFVATFVRFAVTFVRFAVTFVGFFVRLRWRRTSVSRRSRTTPTLSWALSRSRARNAAAALLTQMVVLSAR